tara:strand:- start:2471 stop:3142 length:672 start_codon:yes stop_codon:yes gene_type:complete
MSSISNTKTNSKRTKKGNKKRATNRPNISDIKQVYTNTEYDSNDGMLTAIWGPGMWHYLHTMSFNYPVYPSKNDKKHYRDFIRNLQYVLPCGKCRINLQNNFKKLPLTMKHLKNRSAFSRYIFDLHELINTMLCKVSGLTYEVVRERYEHFRARCTKKRQKHTRKRVRFSNVVKENGCTEPLYGEKSKCVLQIVPQTTKCDTLTIDNQCVKERNVVSSVLKNI